MKKTFVRVLTSVLAFVCCLNAFIGCSGGEETSSGSVGEEKYEPVDYVDNGESLSDYSIVVSQTANAVVSYGAETLQARIKQAAGVELPIITDAMPERELEIILGETNRAESASVNFSALGEESFVVQNVESDLVIAGNDRGLLYGVYAYLEAIGFRFYTPTTEKIPYADEVFVPEEIKLTWTPTFDYRETMYCSTWDADWAVSQRINSDFQRADLKRDEKYGGFAGYIGGGS